MEAHVDRVLPEALDRLGELDAASVHLDAPGRSASAISDGVTDP